MRQETAEWCQKATPLFLAVAAASQPRSPSPKPAVAGGKQGGSEEEGEGSVAAVAALLSVEAGLVRAQLALRGGAVNGTALHCAAALGHVPSVAALMHAATLSGLGVEEYVRSTPGSAELELASQPRAALALP